MSYTVLALKMLFVKAECSLCRTLNLFGATSLVFGQTRFARRGGRKGEITVIFVRGS